MRKISFVFALLLLSFYSSFTFQSDELLVDDDEFGLEGQPATPQPRSVESARSTPTTTRKHFVESDSKIQFTLDHAFGDSNFTPAGTFSARLKPLSQGGQVSEEYENYCGR